MCAPLFGREHEQTQKEKKTFIMALIVQKYGGTSVGNPERIKNVAKRVVRTKEQGNDVVVVVSAMSGETDKLIGLANQVNDNPDPREMDMLLSTGERVTIVAPLAAEDRRVLEQHPALGARILAVVPFLCAVPSLFHQLANSTLLHTPAATSARI